jgi:hypothetical protein
MTSTQPKARGIGRTLGKMFAWLVLVVVVLVIGVVVFVLTFDWNRMKPTVNEKVSEAIGRPFAIEGDLKVGWRHPVGETGWRGWVPWPRFSATRITIANPDWTKQPHFATLDEIDFEVEVLPLIAHDIVIPAINLVNPSIDADRAVDVEARSARHRVRQGLCRGRRPAVEDRCADRGRYARPADSDRRRVEAAGERVAQRLGAADRALGREPARAAGEEGRGGRGGERSGRGRAGGERGEWGWGRAGCIRCIACVGHGASVGRGGRVDTEPRGRERECTG